MNIPPVAFLGVADVFNIQRNIDPRFRVFNIGGLRSEIISQIYPLPLKSLQVVFAIYDPTNIGTFHISLALKDKEVFGLDFGTQVLKAEDIPQPHGTLDDRLLVLERSWEVYPVTLSTEHFPHVLEPMDMDVKLNWNNTEYKIGVIKFLYVPAKRLTPERIMAIRSDPQASKSAKYAVTCKYCKDEIKIFAALDKSENEESFIWYEDVPENFVCTCAKTTVNLRYIRESFHSVLGRRFGQIGDEIYLSKLYGKSVLEEIFERFNGLLESNPDEETVQKFLAQNTILFHQFSPDLLISKAPLLTKYKSDFVILTKSADLYFIEIESPQKRILKTDGVNADFTHAVGQVRDWIHLFNEHRSACVEMMGLPAKIGSVRGIVIMGRDQNENSADLIKHKSFDLGQVNFFTYDDLLGSLGSLIANFK